MSIYEMIYYDILNKIATKVYDNGSLLPSEKEFMKLFNCSLAPVRQAMSKLESMGLVERKRGKGTFVKTTDPKDYLQGGNGFTQILYQEREHITYLTLDAKIVEASETVAAKLNVVPGQNVIRIRRIGKYRDEPMQYSQHHIPYVDKLELIKKEGHIFNWYFFMAGKLGIGIVKSVDEVFLEKPDAETRTQLLPGKPPETPLISIDRVSFDDMQRPQEYSIYTHTMAPMGGGKIRFIYEVNW